MKSLLTHKVTFTLIDRGFTLIESMIVVLLIGILASIAYPTYISHLIKSHRTDALVSLTQEQITLERCYAQNSSYNQACDSLPSFPKISLHGYYQLTLSDLGTATYTLTATPIGSQKNDSHCARFTINQTNVKIAFDASGTAQSRCWSPTS